MSACVNPVTECMYLHAESPKSHALVCCSLVIATCLQELQAPWKMCPSYTTQTSLALFLSSHRLNCQKEWINHVKAIPGRLLYIWIGKAVVEGKELLKQSLPKRRLLSFQLEFASEQLLIMKVYNDSEIKFPELYIILFMSSLRERNSRIPFWVSQITWISSYVIRKLFCIKYKRGFQQLGLAITLLCYNFKILLHACE